MRIDNEEFITDEVSQIKENMIFEAEEFIDIELIKQSMETYKTIEVEKISTSTPPKNQSYSNTTTKFDRLKTGLNSITSTLTTATIAVATVAVGVVPIVNGEEGVEEIVYGDVEILNYYVDYNYYNEQLQSDVKIFYKNELLDGYKLAFKNKGTNEIKFPTFEYVTFSDIGSTVVTFGMIIYDNDNNEVDSFDFPINPITDFYQGEGKITNYSIEKNENETYDLLLYLENTHEQLETTIMDLEGNQLIYETIYQNNEVLISDIDIEIFDVEIKSYITDGTNYYNDKSYHLNSFNVIDPSAIEFERFEILNDSYIEELGIPTYIYLDGTLMLNDYVDVIVYNSTGEVIDSVYNITYLQKPIIFYDLPIGEILKFEYRVYNNDKVIKLDYHETNLEISEEYLSLDVVFHGMNPGDGLYTYNNDSTFNYYSYTGFENKSDYEVSYKLELTTYEEGIKYEYYGNGLVGEFLNVKSNEYYSLIYKVFVKEGINYYAIKDFYLASGSVGLELDESGKLQYSTISVYSEEEKLYAISKYIETTGNLVATVTLSSGEVLEYTFTEEQMLETMYIDLREYEESCTQIEVKVLGNPNYGMGDSILQTNTIIVGEIYTELVEVYEENTE